MSSVSQLIRKAHLGPVKDWKSQNKMLHHVLNLSLTWKSINLRLLINKVTKRKIIKFLKIIKIKKMESKPKFKWTLKLISHPPWHFSIKFIKINCWDKIQTKSKRVGKLKINIGSSLKAIGYQRWENPCSYLS